MSLSGNILISVLLPVYNAEKYIAEAVDSILNQTFTEFELIILDDGCTDSTIEIVNSFEDDRIQVVQNSQNLGLIATLNKGIKIAKGEYIARMDADDIALPQRFEKQIDFFKEHPNVGVLGSNIETFGSENKRSNLPLSFEEIQLVKYFSNPIAHPTAIIKKKLLVENNICYRTELLHAEDWGLWMDLSKVTEIHNLSEPLLKYRMEGQNITVKNHDSLKARMFVFYKIYLTELFENVDDDLCQQHWCFVKTKYDLNTDWIALIEQYSIAFKKKGMPESVINQYFDSISDDLFYGIANVSPKKAIQFAKMRGTLTRQKRIYALKKTLKP